MNNKKLAAIALVLVGIAVVAWKYLKPAGGGGGGGCTIDSDCPAGQVCQNGVCVPAGGGGGCTVDSDCPAGQVCQNGVCVPAGGGGDGSTLVTVHVKIKSYGPEAKYWVTLIDDINENVAKPVDQEFIWPKIRADSLQSGFPIVDIYDGDPTYGNGSSLRWSPSYPNLGHGLGFASLLVDGETIYWKADQGLWTDAQGNWL